MSMDSGVSGAGSQGLDLMPILAPYVDDSGPQFLHLQCGDNHTHLLGNLCKWQAHRQFSP